MGETTGWPAIASVSVCFYTCLGWAGTYMARSQLSWVLSLSLSFVGWLLNLIFQVDFTTREDDNNNKVATLYWILTEQFIDVSPLTQSQDSHALGLFYRQGPSACRERSPAGSNLTHAVALHVSSQRLVFSYVFHWTRFSEQPSRGRTHLFTPSCKWNHFFFINTVIKIDNIHCS